MAVWEAYRPSQPQFGPWESALASAALLLLLWVAARLRVLMTLGRLAGPRPPADPAKRGRKVISELHVLAVAALAFMIIAFDLKAHISSLPLVASSETLSGLCAVALYFLMLALVWSATHPLEKVVFQNGLSRGQFVWGQMRFVAPVVFPWLAVVLLRDLSPLVWPAAGAWLASGTGDLAFLAAFVALMAVFFPWLVRLWWGCRDWPPGPVRELAESVLARAGVRVGAILSWPILRGRLLTAGILGVAPRFRYLLLSPALVEAMSPQELAGVVAHEAGHVHHRHLVSYLLFFLGFFILAYALAWPMALGVQVAALWLAGTSWGAGLLAGDDPGGGLFSVFLALPLVALLVLYLRFVMGYFMRNFERQADLFALRLMGEARPLAGALEKVAQLSGDARDVPSWHHFSVGQRVAVLLRAQDRPELMDAHARGLKTALALYLALLIGASGLGLASGHLGWGEGMQRRMVVRAMENRLAMNPHDAALRLGLGIMAMEDGDEPKALRHLRAAAELAPQDPETLNSLAWLYATAKDPAMRRPALALALALEAVRRSPLPHIWDTLAEAYYVNGQYQMALAASRSALQAGPRQRVEYFQRQLARFEKLANTPKP